MQFSTLHGWLGALSRACPSICLAHVVLLAMVLGTTQSFADSSLVIVDAQGKSTELSASALLARPDGAVIDVGRNGDIYHHSVTYRGVPLLSLLASIGDFPHNEADTLEAEATDGFVSQIPVPLVAHGADGGSVAWIAIEDTAHPWPPLPDSKESAGPFYLVWEHPERSGVSREQWPYQLKKLKLVADPAHRWPQIALDASEPAASPARRGQSVFIDNCLPCHRMKGGGAGMNGPDLGEPTPVTRYLSDAGLRAIIRDPASVRTWPGQRMVGFSKLALSNPDLDALIAYLHAMAIPAVP